MKPDPTMKYPFDQLTEPSKERAFHKWRRTFFFDDSFSNDEIYINFVNDTKKCNRLFDINGNFNW